MFTMFVFSALSICVLCIGSPIAWIDHFFDFHLEIEKPQWYKQEETEKEDRLWKEIEEGNRSNSRDNYNDRERDTTCHPDRDR